MRFFDGLKKMDELLAKYPTLQYHDAYIEEILLAAYYWTTVQQYNNKQPPADYPLKQFTILHSARQPDIEREFMRENRSRF